LIERRKPERQEHPRQKFFAVERREQRRQAALLENPVSVLNRFALSVPGVPLALEISL